MRLDVNSAFAVAIDVQADVHQLPFGECAFDSVVSIAVLEHTKYAWEVAREFHRVLKPEGIAVVAIPFLQPRHGAPEDYVRFTDTGIRALMEWGGFDVIDVQPVHTLGYTAEWVLREILNEHALLRHLMYPIRLNYIPATAQRTIFAPANWKFAQCILCCCAKAEG